MNPSPFEMLLDDLAAVQERRNTQAPSRDTAEARRMQQRTLKKSAPLPDYTPDWDGLAARQEQIAADLEQSRQQAQQDAIRAHLATLRAAAKAGRLSSFEAAKYDALVGQAAALGLQP
mgnify:CR=1 FL=1